ncbi:MAG: DUF4369 domain-containing protein [Prevotellaceae bacterium]|jgi:hypothetical protein|nr:DUF4369 domain-containing protein [Prevotellaceae bacterium]
MKCNRSPIVCTLLLAALAACSSTPDTDVLISGNIRGMGNDTIYLYGIDRLYDRIDTLVSKDDKFTARLSVDTLSTTLLLFSDGTEYPLFMDKAQQIDIKGDFTALGNLQIGGNLPNQQMSQFYRDMNGLTQPSEALLEERADTFITTHPNSLASVYLLHKYFVLQPQPDYARIRRLTEHMTGELRDRPYLTDLQKRLDEMSNTDVGKNMPFFRIPRANGKDITRSDFSDKYLLIHFWASWDTVSRAHNSVYRRIYKKTEKSKLFAMLGISLDIDKKQWLHALDTDTLKWTQAGELNGWNSPLIKQLSISTLPANLLLSPSGRIEARNIDEAGINAKLEQIAAEEKERERREKERKQRERRERERNRNRN